MLGCGEEIKTSLSILLFWGAVESECNNYNTVLMSIKTVLIRETMLIRCACRPWYKMNHEQSDDNDHYISHCHHLTHDSSCTVMYVINARLIECKHLKI